MRQIVAKYPFKPNDYIAFELPATARLLHVDVQNEQLCLWALVDLDQPTISRRVRMAGTGHQIKEPAESLRHVSTVLLSDGALVFHFFEVLAP